jgi:hypothetical protein
MPTVPAQLRLCIMRRQVPLSTSNEQSSLLETAASALDCSLSLHPKLNEQRAKADSFLSYIPKMIKLMYPKRALLTKTVVDSAPPPRPLQPILQRSNPKSP